jgi:isopenicillin N synthase-like dioxygenase
MNVLRVDANNPNAPSQFVQSLKETGFAVLYNHPVDLDLIEAVYDEWRQFFNSDIKENYLYNHQTQDGFFPTRISETAKGFKVKDIKEFFQYYPWGQYPSTLTDKTKQLYSALEKLAVTLLNWIEAGLPKKIKDNLSVPLSDMLINTPKNMLRILHYPALDGKEPAGAIRAAEHGDIDLLTLLVGATDAGLQVKDADNQWHNVPTDKHSIAVNIGDMLEMCTEGYFCSTLHRVINPKETNEARLSMPLFLHPHPSVVLKKNVTADDFLKERIREIGTY